MTPSPWHAPPHVVSLAADGLHRAAIPDPAAALGALRALAAGKSPAEVMGWSRQSLPMDAVRSVEFVPDARAVLVKREWWREPWRLTFEDAESAQRFFDEVCAVLPARSEAVEARIGANDLAMDPAVAVGVILVIGGMVALVGGAIDGAGVVGPAGGMVLAMLGESIGPAAALAVAGAAVAAGVVALTLWHRRRPRKVVVRAIRR